MRIERLRKAYGLRVKWVHFPLHPDTPAEGRSLEALFAGRGYDIEKRQAEMRARMQAEGLPYGKRTMTYNSRLAQELGLRRTPVLAFEYDPAVERGVRLTKMIDELAPEGPDGEGG